MIKMKTTLLITLLLSMTVANAQEFELNEKGAYERQKVIQVEGATAVQLYDRAMIALSDWTGSDGKAKVGIDYQNQESSHTYIQRNVLSWLQTCNYKRMGSLWQLYITNTLQGRTCSINFNSPYSDLYLRQGWHHKSLWATRSIRRKRKSRKEKEGTNGKIDRQS